MPSANYVQRTEWNVRDSDATVVISIGAFLTGGSRNSVKFAKKHGRPVLHLSKASGISVAAASLRHFIEEHGVKILNVAGPRASKEPEVAEFVKEVLDRTWPSR
jgi:Circularly permutated YpsA SLOG family